MNNYECIGKVFVGFLGVFVVGFMLWIGGSAVNNYYKRSELNIDEYRAVKELTEHSLMAKKLAGQLMGAKGGKLTEHDWDLIYQEAVRERFQKVKDEIIK